MHSGMVLLHLNFMLQSYLQVLIGGVDFLQDDLEIINRSGQGRVDVSVGSALDLFGGKMSYEEVVFWHLQQKSSS